MDQDLVKKKKDFVRFLIEKDILITGDLSEQLRNISSLDEFNDFLRSNSEKFDIMVPDSTTDENDSEGKFSSSQEGSVGTVKIVSSYNKVSEKRCLEDFVSYFNARFNAIKKMLLSRQELQGTISISRLKSRTEKESVSLIGLIKEKRETPNGHIMLVLEDNTGTVKVLINKNKPDMLSMMKDSVLDEVIGIVGVNGDNIVFANSVILPDIPLTKELRKSPEEGYALFITCTHFGSKLFMEEEFRKFIKWLRGETGSEKQKDLARKTKYVFLLGDLVEGVGIYPGQENDLTVPDIVDQYDGFAKILAEIPERIKVIVAPGNHDAVRIEEPQPVLDKELAAAIWDIPNVIMVSNPSIVNIDSSDIFPGLDVLVYHGFSFVFYSDAVPSIRAKGGQARADLVMKFLLQRRHLAPTHSSTLYLPDPDEDPLVIDKIPDIFATGHVHRVAASQYRNVTTLSCSCFAETSDYQIKLGITNEPAKVHAINLSTRDVKVLNFNKE